MPARYPGIQRDGSGEPRAGKGASESVLGPATDPPTHPRSFSQSRHRPQVARGFAPAGPFLRRERARRPAHQWRGPGPSRPAPGEERLCVARLTRGRVSVGRLLGGVHLQGATLSCRAPRAPSTPRPSRCRAPAFDWPARQCKCRAPASAWRGAGRAGGDEGRVRRPPASRRAGLGPVDGASRRFRRLRRRRRAWIIRIGGANSRRTQIRAAGRGPRAIVRWGYSHLGPACSAAQKPASLLYRIRPRLPNPWCGGMERGGLGRAIGPLGICESRGRRRGEQ